MNHGGLRWWRVGTAYGGHEDTPMAGDWDPNSDRKATLPAIGDVPLSEERRARLAPLLRILLDDFARLEELEQSDPEPSLVFRPWGEVGDERG